MDRLGFIAYSLQVLSFALLAQSAAAEVPVPYSALSPKQQAIFEQFSLGQDPSKTAQEYWEKDLDQSQKTTYIGATHAMEQTPLSVSGSALDLIFSVEAIHGQIGGARSAAQFNLQVTWSKDAQAELMKVGFSWRLGSGHVGEHGLSFHSQVTGLHLLFANADPTRGHLHVDYRGLLEGHSRSYNADLLATGPQKTGEIFGAPICNLCRHEKWFGKIQGVEVEAGE